MKRFLYPKYCNIIPLVYDETLTYYEQLCKMKYKINELIEYVKSLTDEPRIEYIGTWDIEIEYPKYSLVSYDNKVYIALKDVPEGTDIENEEYWSEIGEFTFALDEMRQLLDEYMEDVDGKLDALEDNVNDALGEMQTNVDALEIKVDKTDDIKALTPGKNIVFYGDSWCTGSGASTSANQLTTLCANALELNEINLSVGAAGFTRPGNLIEDQINAQNIRAEDIEKTNYVVILSGVNDIRHYADTNLVALSNAIIRCARLASAKFPNAIIVMGIMTTVRNGISDTHKYWMGYTIDRLMSACVERVIVADMRYILYNRVNAYTSDNFHPNDFGHGLVASQIINAILGNKSECYHYIETGLVFDSALADAPSGGHIFFNNGILNVTECRLNFVNPISTKTLIGNVHASVIPNNNVYTPFYFNDSQAGVFAIAGGTGNVYIIPNEGVTLTTGFVQPFNYTA